MAFLYLYVVPFHAGIVICLVKDFLFKSILKPCGNQRDIELVVAEDFVLFCFFETKNIKVHPKVLKLEFQIKSLNIPCYFIEGYIQQKLTP